MDFWSGLKKILGVAGSAAAIPFTGGWSAAAIPGILGTAGAAASALGQGRAQGRIDEAGMARTQNQDAYQRALLELQQKQFGLDAPRQRARNAVYGDALAGLQTSTITGLPERISSRMGQIEGGFDASKMLTPGTRQLGADMSRQALVQQMAGDQFAPMQTAEYPQATGTDKMLNVVGAVGGISDIFKELMQKKYGVPLATNPWTNAVPPKITLPKPPQELPSFSSRPYGSLFGG